MQEEFSSEEPKTKLPANEQEVKLQDFTRDVTAKEIEVLKKTLGSSAINKLEKGISNILLEKEERNGTNTYVALHGDRVITISNTPDIGMVDISFEFKDDYLARKSGKFTQDESFKTSSPKLRPGTIKFLRFMGDFLSEISENCHVRLVADEKRMPIYKKFLDKLGKDNIKLAPKSFTIDSSEV
jgi:hypothetical protein